jgi:hypothetical protein
MAGTVENGRGLDEGRRGIVGLRMSPQLVEPPDTVEVEDNTEQLQDKQEFLIDC